MKKVLVGCLLLSSFAFSEVKSDPVSVMTMRGYESAMTRIGKGFLRNNLNMVKLGTQNLTKNSKMIDSFMIESDEENFDAKAYAAKEADVIESLANEILAKFEAGKNDEARNAYDRAMTQCLACHRIIRKW